MSLPMARALELVDLKVLSKPNYSMIPYIYIYGIYICRIYIKEDGHKHPV